MIYSCGSICFATYVLVIDWKFDEVAKLNMTQSYHEMGTLKQLLKFYSYTFKFLLDSFFLFFPLGEGISFNNE